jgi:hypothetical protein
MEFPICYKNNQFPSILSILLSNLRMINTILLQIIVGMEVTFRFLLKEASIGNNHLIHLNGTN